MGDVYALPAAGPLPRGCVADTREKSATLAKVQVYMIVGIHESLYAE
jgi:hypothetical protein